MKIYTCLIVDDESPARKKIIRFLKDIRPDFKLLEADNGQQAVNKIDQHKPDIVFLDIQMPGMTGFEVIREIGAEQMPAVIFTTAYDQYAIDAFEVEAVDYLLKPFDKERFEKAVKRVLQQIESKKDNISQLNVLLKKLRTDQPYLNRLLVNERSKYFFVPVEKIIYIKSCEKYVQLNCTMGKYLLRSTMNDIEKKLNPQNFCRIHRTNIININYLKSIDPISHGDYIVHMHDGTELTLSRRYKSRLLK